MRSLFVSGMYPWPEIDGLRKRIGNQLVALAEAGEVDFFCPDAWYDTVDAEPAPDGIRVLRVPSRRRSTLDVAAHWVTGREPRALLRSDVSDALERFADWRLPDYDLVFLTHITGWSLFRGQVDAPTVVDVNDLDDRYLATRIEREASDHPSWRERARTLVDRTDVGRLSRTIRRCSEESELVFLCSELDVERSGLANAVAIPNGAELAWEPVDHSPVPTAPPTIAFVGLMSYAPNEDAARWFATEILPLVRAEIPDVTFRAVGRGSEAIDDLGTLPGVVVTGAVDSLEPEMARADLAVVPIRFGGGTRLKVTEALANRLPVVTTTVGCEGIDVVDGRSALIVDDAAGFASACVRALTDAPLRAGLVAEGATLFETRYQWSQIRRRLADLCRTVAEGRSDDRVADDRR